jgi:hypothetical protein
MLTLPQTMEYLMFSSPKWKRRMFNMFPSYFKRVCNKRYERYARFKGESSTKWIDHARASVYAKATAG